MQYRFSIYFNSTGYARAAIDYIKAIQQIRPDINIKTNAINGIKKQNGISHEDYNWFCKLSSAPAKSEYISYQHCIPKIYVSDHAKKRIGFSIFETIDPPLSWVKRMNEMDVIVTASSFNKSCFESAGVKKPIELVPHCIDMSKFNKEVKPEGRYNLFTFMYIASWRDRKNYATLIKAFYDAFSIKDHVCLVLKTDKNEALKRTISSIKNDNYKTKDTAPIFLENDIIPFEKMPQLMAKADVYISPSLSEGFGLPTAQAMALGIPVILVRYGGALEYAKPEFCTYLNPNGYKKRAVLDGLPQFNNKIWPEITANEIKEKLIFAHKSYAHLQQKANEAYKYVHQHLNYDIIGRRMLSVFES